MRRRGAGHHGFGTIVITEVANAHPTPTRPSARDEIVRRRLRAFDGREIKLTDDGLVAMFETPVDAVRCTLGVRDDARALGADLRAGVHTGEFEIHDNDVCGETVALCRRLVGAASPGEVLVTQTAAELFGSDTPRVKPSLVERGIRRLKGLGSLRVFVAMNAQPVTAKT